MPIQDKFASENPYILTALMQTADNNQKALKGSLDEASGVAASSVIFQQTGLNGTVGAPLPTATAAANQTIGAALSGAGSTPNTPSCFTYKTPILLENGKEKFIGEITVGTDIVKTFDKLGNVVNALCVGKWEHIVNDLMYVYFEDGRVTKTTPNHRYWQGGEDFLPIAFAGFVYHFDGNGFIKQKILSKIPVHLEQPVFVYNLTVDIYHTYIAGGDAVSNLKPLDDGFGEFGE